MSDLVGNPEDRFSRVAAHIQVFGMLAFSTDSGLMSFMYLIGR